MFYINMDGGYLCILMNKNLQGLETTATFDKENDQFILHTPSISAVKFWPGELGKFASHAAVFAKLILNGEVCGMAPFIVQIRDTKTYDPMPGCEMGDIGPKFGYNSKDNGYLILN